VHIALQEGQMSDSYNLQVRMTLAEKQGFEAAAKASGVSLSAWVRDRLRRSAREELQASGILVPFIAEMKVPDSEQ
jgi:hypothetical protein